jgi:hypothetical protein
MNCSIEIPETKLDEMAKKGWLSKSSRDGIKVLEPGTKIAIETMRLYSDPDEGVPVSWENEWYITLVFLADFVGLSLPWTQAQPRRK